jgi:hypothetical protein
MQKARSQEQVIESLLMIGHNLPEMKATVLLAIKLIREGEGWKAHANNLQAALNFAVENEKKLRSRRKAAKE